MSEVNGDQFLRVWELDKLLAGDVKPLSEFRFGQSVPESFVFSRDGRYLYGSSYYTGVSNIFRYEVATGKIEAVSNAETGFFRPVPLADGRLLVLTYTARASFPRPSIRARSRTSARSSSSARRSPRSIRSSRRGRCRRQHRRRRKARSPARARTSRCKSLALDNAYPVLQGYKNYVGIGYHSNFEDPLRIREVWASPPPIRRQQPARQSARPRRHRPGEYLGWRAALSWNRSDFYDLFGPTKRSRKGYAAKLGYD